ncbi:MAG: hypothetical protein ACLTTU_09235 [Bilophila wadsworthia]
MNPTLNILGISGSLRASPTMPGSCGSVFPTVNFKSPISPMFLFTMPIVVIPNLNQYKC